VAGADDFPAAASEHPSENFRRGDHKATLESDDNSLGLLVVIRFLFAFDSACGTPLNDANCG
jgi:hypothetical protein